MSQNKLILFLDRAIIEQLESAAAYNTDEVCGFLLGHEDKFVRTITRIIPVDNIAADKKDAFQIASKDYLKAERFADVNNLQLLGVYHSHPNCPAIPSEQDRLAAQPYFSYLILSVTDKKVTSIRSWSLNDSFQFDEDFLMSTNNINQHINGYRNYPNTAA
ncbi:M67 family metallopeptidase [Chryseolinea sp. H1M3-3]|uniref:M67 family metallopeptidase n=1 Tax=Chryseolinea sp. H1M3-3 TaxID=3034144 RepID=UPI0023EAAE5E|nr:M67 family metallopeptidase [Chryseolinea sp. H1M3-3]